MGIYRLQTKEEYKTKIVGPRHSKWNFLWPLFILGIGLISTNNVSLSALLEIWAISIGFSLLLFFFYLRGERQIRKSMHRKAISRRRVFPQFAYAHAPTGCTPITGITTFSDPVLGPLRSSSIAFDPGSQLDAETGPLWMCPRCGEKIESQFLSCWQCGTQRPSNA